MWTLGRQLWMSLARFLRLPHTVPWLADEIEFMLLVLVLYTSICKHTTQGLICSVATATFLHVFRGARWQLVPVYPVLISILVFSGVPIVAKCLYFLSVVLALLLCFLVPFNAPIKATLSNDDSLVVGIQDIALCDSNQHKDEFVIRAYYPIDRNGPHGSKAAVRRPFFNDICLVFTVLTGTLGIRFCDPDAQRESTILWLILFALYAGQLLLEIADNTQYSLYFPEGFSMVTAFTKFAELPFFIMSHLPYVKLHCQEDAAVAANANEIMIFYPGLAGHRTTHAALCMRAAAEGFFVVCLESSDKTPALTFTPSNGARPYFGYKEFLKTINEGSVGGTSKSEEKLLHEWRHGQINIRAKETKIIMDFLKDPSSFSQNIHLGYQATTVINIDWWKQIQSFFFPYSTHSYSNKQQALERSLFWKSLQQHHFLHFHPYLVGHSFGGATVLSLMSDLSDEAVQLRQHYPLAAVVSHDPWTPIALTEQTKHNKDNTIVDFPVMVMYAEKFTGFEEYNLINACKQVIFFEIQDAGHHSYNEFAFSAPVISSRLGNVGKKQDLYAVLNNINTITLNFFHEVRSKSSGNDSNVLSQNSSFSGKSNSRLEEMVSLSNTTTTATTNRAFDFTACVEFIKAIPNFKLLKYKP